MDRIHQNHLLSGFQKYQKEFEEKALSVLRSGQYILGQEVLNFEKEFSKYLDVNHCIGVANGLDALTIALRILGIGQGDEVLVQANAYIASVMSISHNGAIPIFVEPDEYHQIDARLIENKITNKTKAILVVHLYGHTAQMDAIVEICQKYNLKLIEDCAQSHGSTYNGKKSGTFGDVGCFSFYPTKNLGAFGDAGAIVTNSQHLAQEFRIFRNYGSEKRYHNKMIGINSRLDELQAGLLRIKLNHIDEIISRRQQIAYRYSTEINNKKIVLPKERPHSTNVYHQYVICCNERDKLINHLVSLGIDTLIHYPIPPHLSEAYSSLGFKNGTFPITEKYANEVLSLPIYNEITYDEQTYVIDALNNF